MEELIEILINLIASFFQNKAIKPVVPPTRQAPPVQQPVRPIPTGQKKPPQRRQQRRPAPPQTIAVAQPIITNTAAAPAQYVVPMAARSTIIANAGIPAAHQTPSQSAESIRKWLTPSTLKHQFLLTEILQKPLALRDQR
jgi:hypothetical protein